MCEKVAERQLPLTILDAELQFDRHKLVFFFEADRRIDFRELVSELFSQYKTRIWMQQVDTTVIVSDDPGTKLSRSAGLLLPEGQSVVSRAKYYSRRPITSATRRVLGGTDAEVAEAAYFDAPAPPINIPSLATSTSSRSQQQQLEAQLQLQRQIHKERLEREIVSLSTGASEAGSGQHLFQPLLQLQQSQLQSQAHSPRGLSLPTASTAALFTSSSSAAPPGSPTRSLDELAPLSLDYSSSPTESSGININIQDFLS